MAEGGYLPLEDLDPTELNEPKDDDADDDDNMEMDPISSTTRLIKPDDVEAETSFGGRDYEKEGARPKTKSGYTKLAGEDIDEIERNKDETWFYILKIFPDAKPNFLFKFNEWDKIEVAIPRKNPKNIKWHYLFDDYGYVNKKLPKSIKDALGSTAEEKIKAFDDELEKEKKHIVKILRGKNI